MKEPDQTWWNLNRIQSWVNSTGPMLVPKLWQTYQGPIESPMDCKEIKSVNLKGNQPWIFIGRTDAEAEAPILWPPDEKSWLIGKVPDVGKDWGQEKGAMGDEMVKWHLQCRDMSLSKLQEIVKNREAWRATVHGGHKELDTTEWVNNNKSYLIRKSIFLDLAH